MTEQEFLLIEFNGGEIADAIIRWRGLGFLEGSQNTTNHSIAFELLAKWLLHTEKKYSEELETILFAVIYRIMKQYEDNIPIAIIKKLVLDLADRFPIKRYIECGQNNTQNNHHRGIDAEAYFLVDYCESYPPLITI